MILIVLATGFATERSETGCQDRLRSGIADPRKRDKSRRSGMT